MKRAKWPEWGQAISKLMVSHRFGFVFVLAAKANPAVADWLGHPSRGGGERADFGGA